MNQVHIAETISKSIKEAKWLLIEYKNVQEDIKEFWVSISGINSEKKSFEILMYNMNKDGSVKNGWIFFDSILRAEIIEGTTYEVPLFLKEQIDRDIKKLGWLHFDGYDNNILNYLEECYKYDNDPYQEDFNLIEGIDFDTLRRNNIYQLNEIQFHLIAKDIYNMALNQRKRKIQQLALNVLSISEENKLYVVAYRQVLLDVEKKQLSLAKELSFNKSFLIDENKKSLSYYLDIDPDEFCNEYESNSDQYKENLAANLQNGESLDEKPYLMILRRDMTVNLKKTFNGINQLKNNNQLTKPLNAFFGNSTVNNDAKPQTQICLKDNKFNIDQLRVVFNAMRNPITYVQGPPGTGKTATIINIVLSAFINQQTVLITSNNNKPVNEIYDKLKFFHNRDLVPFPILRLGRKDDNLKALKKIALLYDQSKKIIIKDYALNKSKSSLTRNFKKLNDLLINYEKRLELAERLDVLKGLTKGLKEVRVSNALLIEQQKLEEEYHQIGEIKDEDVMKLTFIADDSKDDFHFMRYLYYKSFEYIKKLDNGYKWLFDIIKLPENTPEEELDKNKKLINSLNDQAKLNKLLEAFPFIVTTNLSSNKLGDAKPSFDLCIMDEAGQCNIATSLISIIRGKRLVLIGDQNQLQPVVVLDDNRNRGLMKKYYISEEYDYCDNSIIKLMQEKDKVSPFILLRYHYRCGRKIIQYSNQRYYNNQLSIKTALSANQLELHPVVTEGAQELRNTSYQEAAEIVDTIVKNKYQDVGIITPFRNQASLINKLLIKRNIEGIEAGTIHSFQGDEKKVIIFSTAITQATSDKTYSWVSDNKELINVAVTRAKDKFILVGDDSIIDNKANQKDNDLNSLIKHVKTEGTYVVPPRRGTEYLGLKQYDTTKEAEFLKTIQHIMTTVEDLEVKTKVKISTVFSKEYINNNDLYYTGEFDFVIYDANTKFPVLIFEIDGNEHIINQRSVNNDRLKEETTRINNIPIIRIPNNYVKRYELVKRMLLDIY